MLYLDSNGIDVDIGSYQGSQNILVIWLSQLGSQKNWYWLFIFQAVTYQLTVEKLADRRPSKIYRQASIVNELKAKNQQASACEDNHPKRARKNQKTS